MALPVSWKSKDVPSASRSGRYHYVIDSIANVSPSEQYMEQAFVNALRAVAKSYQKGVVSHDRTKAIISALVAGYTSAVLVRKVEDMLLHHFDSPAAWERAKGGGRA